MWHDVSELPEEYRNIILITKEKIIYTGYIDNCNTFLIYEINDYNSYYNKASFKDIVIKWCYQEDVIKQAMKENYENK